MPERPEEKTPFIKIVNETPDLRKKEQPMVDIKVTNPIEYLKRFWKRVIANEGIEFKFKIRPLTAIAIAVVVVSLSYGIGNKYVVDSIPFTPSPTPQPYRDSAFTGELKFSKDTGKYYLFTSSSEAITLDVPKNVDLTDLLGKRIFAAGQYNLDARSLKVLSVENLEVLPSEKVPFPTSSPSPAPTSKPTETPAGDSTSSGQAD